MTASSATIIDFSAYRLNKRTVAKLSRDTVCSAAPHGAIASYYFFWLFLAWTPFRLLCLPASKQECRDAIRFRGELVSEFCSSFLLTLPICAGCDRTENRCGSSESIASAAA
ncbi:hypothetical protein [Bradyrhizobium sp. WSM2793]|uniref:hypothetical protein n=1 Tax=Bradyrhizobium sp. WSM2793 TaxID=1038866 RepID=UPI0012F991FC|nr:hypothetical protein [Bradyrhizobium sp. WSM2793]